MSDDLVKRLRDWEHVWPEDMNKPEGHLYEEAADLIEELEAKLRWVLDERDATFALMLKRAETAEAKLAKVVELVERAFNEGVGEGMNDVLRQARRIEELEAKLAKATELLIHSTEENLWNAYYSGDCDEADAWTHMFMSDGEWLVQEIGLDPEQARYDAEEIRDSIPATARKIVLAELTGGKDE